MLKFIKRLFKKPIKKSIYKCGICGKVTLTKHGVRVHIGKMHT